MIFNNPAQRANPKLETEIEKEEISPRTTFGRDDEFKEFVFKTHIDIRPKVVISTEAEKSLE